MPEWKLQYLENARMENAHHGKCKKKHILENDRNYTTGECQNGKWTTWKMIEKPHPGK